MPWLIRHIQEIEGSRALIQSMSFFAGCNAVPFVRLPSAVLTQTLKPVPFSIVYGPAKPQFPVRIRLTLHSGDCVLIYTDGAVEATNGGGYGTSRLVKSLQKPGVSAQSVVTEVQEFASGGTLNDDATAIVLRRE